MVIPGRGGAITLLQLMQEQFFGNHLIAANLQSKKKVVLIWSVEPPCFWSGLDLFTTFCR